MCGISGILSDTRRDAIVPMTQAIEHRGPDASGYYRTNTLLSGNRRLSIIDLVTGNQPIANEAGNLRFVCNGREHAAREPGVDLLVSPTLGVTELPPAGVDELEVRLAVSAFTRPFSYLGWPAIAVGGLHIAGRDAAQVLAAALALEISG